MSKGSRSWTGTEGHPIGHAGTRDEDPHTRSVGAQQPKRQQELSERLRTRRDAFSEMEVEIMQSTFTAITKREGSWWIGWVEEIPGVNCQERTHDGLIESLRSALREAIELNREDALASAERDYTEEPLAV